MSITLLIGAVLGFTLYYLLSEGRNKSGSKSKTLQTKNFLGKLIPSAKFRIKGYEIHVHHWLYLLVILMIIILFFRELFYNYPIIEGFLIGGIIEGLIYKNRFKMFKKI